MRQWHTTSGSGLILKYYDLTKFSIKVRSRYVYSHTLKFPYVFIRVMIYYKYIVSRRFILMGVAKHLHAQQILTTKHYYYSNRRRFKRTGEHTNFF